MIMIAQRTEYIEDDEDDSAVVTRKKKGKVVALNAQEARMQGKGRNKAGRRQGEVKVLKKKLTEAQMVDKYIWRCIFHWHYDY